MHIVRRTSVLVKANPVCVSSLKVVIVMARKKNDGLEVQSETIVRGVSYTPETDENSPENSKNSSKNTLLTPATNVHYPLLVRGNLTSKSVIGVLPDGTGFASEAVAANMCCITRQTLRFMIMNWDKEKYKPRGSYIQKILLETGYTHDRLCLRVNHNGTVINAYPDTVVFAILDYYAMSGNKEAIASRSVFLKYAIRRAIYDIVGYRPAKQTANVATNPIELILPYRTRIAAIPTTIVDLPKGYWCVFVAASRIMMDLESLFTAVRLPMSEYDLVDGSIGIMWRKFRDGKPWAVAEPKQYKHVFQDKRGTRLALCYHKSELGEFDEWLVHTYMPTHFPNYTDGKYRHHENTSYRQLYCNNLPQLVSAFDNRYGNSGASYVKALELANRKTKQLPPSQN